MGWPLAFPNLDPAILFNPKGIRNPHWIFLNKGVFSLLHYLERDNKNANLLVGGGFNFLKISPLSRGDDPNLTHIFPKWVGSTTNICRAIETRNHSPKEFCRRCKRLIVNPTWSPTILLWVLWIVRAKARKNEWPGRRKNPQVWGTHAWKKSKPWRREGSKKCKCMVKFEGFPLNSD